MKLGVLLPTFRDDPSDALALAARAEDVGLDGVFAYDHLWPMNAPARPALAPFPVLAAVARRHPSLHLGPLVARVGLVATSHLVSQFTTLERLAPGRVVAALGTGDRHSAAENEAYGLPARSPSERRELLGAAARSLVKRMPVWIGGGQERTNQVARDVGAEINLWNAPPSAVADVGRTGPVNWAGTLSGEVTTTLDALRDAGASWAVVAAPFDLDVLGQWHGAR